MIKIALLALLPLLVATSIARANFPQDFQAALQLYSSGRFSQARSAFLKLSESAPTPKALDESLVYAAYCEAQLKQSPSAAALASRIRDKYLATLCRMNLSAMDSKYAEVVSLSKNEDFEQWPDGLIYEALTCRANALARTHDLAGAERDYRAALNHTLSDYHKGQVYLKLAALYNDQRSLDALAQIYSLQPGATILCKAVISRATLLAGQGKGELAIAEFDRLKGITRQPHWSMVQMGMAEVYEALGNKAEAQQHYQAIIASENPPADLLKTAKARLNPASKP